MTARATLSVCIIARNESQALPVALGSVVRVANEIVVADTGSTDDTVAVARAHGARVFEISWQDDFAAARNAALGAATSDWILCLDADETLEDGQESKLRALLDRSDADAYHIRIRSPLAGGQSGQVYVHVFPRLFRNRPEFRFQGRVHEQVLPAIEAAGGRVVLSDLTIAHTGYAVGQAAIQAKLERNMALLQLDLADRPADPLQHFHLGETYALLGQPARAVECYEAALRFGGLPPAFTAAALQSLASAELKLARFDAAASAARRVLQVDPTAFTALLILAVARLRQDRLQRAVYWARRYLAACDRRGAAGGTWLGLEPDRPRARLVLAECRLRQGRIALAWREAQAVLAARPDWAAAERLAARILARRGDAGGALAHLQRATTLEPESVRGWLEMTQMQLALHDGEGALATLEAATHHVDDAQLYRWQGHLRLQANRLMDAAESYRNVLRLEPGCQEAHRRLAGLYRKAGDSERALQHLKAMQCAGL